MLIYFLEKSDKMDNYYYELIKDDEHLLRIFKEGIEEDAIGLFDPQLFTKLRSVYYSSISGILYLLGEDNNTNSLENKMQILTYVLEGSDYTLVHGITKTAKRKGLDVTSWIEVRKGRHIWIYDVLSMLKFDKRYFDLLECPEEHRRIHNEVIRRHPIYAETSFKYDYVPLIIMFFLNRYEHNKDNPFYESLQGEIKRYKDDIHYHDVALDYYQEVKTLKPVYNEEGLH